MAKDLVSEAIIAFILLDSVISFIKVKTSTVGDPMKSKDLINRVVVAFILFDSSISFLRVKTLMVG